MTDTPIVIPTSLEEATPVAARYAEISAAKAKIEASRQAKLARINAKADAMVAPLLAEAKPLTSALQEWFGKAPAELLAGKKSIDIGGCTIGTRTGNASLAYSGTDEKVAIAKLLKTVWGLLLVRTTPALDRTAIRKALAGDNKRQLAKMGFSVVTPETFYIDAQPAATIGTPARSA
jgi:phage host-nuclease inhibitor protein Gam